MSGVKLADNYDIQEAWDKACQAFSRMTKVDLTASPKLSVDDKQTKYRAVKDVIRKSKDFIMMLGGIAAQGASMMGLVFAPSSLCFNAISYLIQTGAKYKSIFSSLAELFRCISDPLTSLRKIINEELVCFVDICALSIIVMKGSKILTALKILAFDSDEGVSGQLDRLALLVERESQMRATLGFESQKISEKIIVQTRNGTKKVTASVDRLLTIEQKKDADSVPSTGQWLQNDPLYTSWVRSPGPQFSVLGLFGDEGYGKSFLFAATVNSLQEMHNAREEGMACTPAAYYVFDQDVKGLSLIKALKVLAWQIAQADMVYRNHLSTAQTVGVNHIGSLCDILFLLGEWQTQSTGWSGPNLRILLTGRTEIMSRISDELEDGFIDDRMDKMDILSGSYDQVNYLCAEILEGLAKRTNDDFVNIGLLLDEISTKQRPVEIRDILSRSGENRIDTIVRKIEELNPK
ncbi:hypothetical protein BDV19DRAFT_398708 [Aspergillus venezuelensis]